MEEVFDIETAQYTPQMSYEDLNPAPQEYPSEIRYATDYYTEQAISSSLNDANSSASGWLNTVANLLPGIAQTVKTFLPSGQSSPLPATQAENPSPILSGIMGETRQMSLPSIASQQKTSSNILLYLLIAAGLFFLFFMKRG